MTTRLLAHEDLSGLAPDVWLARLKGSVADRVQSGLTYPDFPPVEAQAAGSAYEDALDEAGKFYALVLAAMGDKAYQRSTGRGYLDFGCGWGQIGRFFLRDFDARDMVGVDTDTGMVAFCAGADLPGRFQAIAEGQALPFTDGQFRLITAYSAFTHLPLGAWLGELLRVLAPGGQLVLMAAPAVSAKLVARAAAPHGGEVVRYIDDPAQFRQAAVVIRKRDPNAHKGLFARLGAWLSGRA